VIRIVTDGSHRKLYILPGKSAQSTSGRLFSYVDFIRAFPMIDTLSIGWSFLNTSNSYRLGLKKAAEEQERRSNNGDSDDPASRITTLHILTLDPQATARQDRDREGIQQLDYVLQQLQFPRLRVLHLMFGAFCGMHVAGSNALWSSLIRAFGRLSCPVLEELVLNCEMFMSRKAIGIDLVVGGKYRVSAGD
jgi:hypothetical protein